MKPAEISRDQGPAGWADVADGLVVQAASPDLPAAGTPFVLLDDCEGGAALLFRNPRSVIVANCADEVAPALDAVRRATAAGGYAAGYLAYEAGLSLEPRLARLIPKTGEEGPLVWFGVFDAPEQLEDVADRLPPPESAWNGPPIPELGKADYDDAFAEVLRLIECGELYQANLTFGARVKVAGPPLALYARLRMAQRARWGGVVFTGDRWLLSASPELFFACVDGALTARPMKGTMPRRASPMEDAATADALRSSQKDRAENLMIVDLMRNDLGRIAKTGSVTVPAMFTIEAYPTVWQMTSTVTAKLRRELGPVDALASLFPCGSVTGAPKVRAMEAIHVAEPQSRGAYTGSIGFVSAEHAAFNVAIRTLALADGAGEARLGLGSGIVADSVAELEWAECQEKGRFLTRARPPVRLLETMRFVPGEGIALLPWHIARIAASARALGFVCPQDVLDGALALALDHVRVPCRVRLLLEQDGRIEVETGPLPARPDGAVQVSLCPLPVGPDDYRLRHKTDDRAFYDRARLDAGIFEVLFHLADGRLTEGSFSSLFVERHGRLATPSGPLIPGVLRAKLIAGGRAFEDDVRIGDLRGGFWIGNAVRGLLPAELIARCSVSPATPLARPRSRLVAGEGLEPPTPGL